MRFEEFVATKTEYADLGAKLSEDTLAGVPGLVYVDKLYIERVHVTYHETKGEGDLWQLRTENVDVISSDLPALEQKLYVYALASGFIGRRFTGYPEAHERGTLMIENYDIIQEMHLRECDLGIQVAGDGRAWVCVNGVALIRFSPHLDGRMKKS